ncbi:hypothetical protein HHI36_021501 [Cryptolaemus montrouzieri]|uniref:Codanin-1 C-terminal domain-containing protein n=1 Tax=Cryptolaemus montrouzieri TaxID=559131 RepID=A0ABD2MXB8_9CUCU
MCENERLKLFSPTLVKILSRFSDAKTERTLNCYETNGKHNICFVLDTDNRSNFPSDVSFQSFKKQRDLFYEILKIWEEDHMVAGWSFEYNLGRKIRTLLNYHQDPINFMRMSRLFMDQLLSTSGKNFLEKNLNETTSTLLTSLPNIDQDKFDRLKNRLVTQQTSKGINSAPEFTGYQEFYKEFIVISSNPSFLKHLCDTFISEINELNGTTFTTLNTESTDNETDEDTKKAYVKCLRSLRTLAKFLGFVECMPYKCDNPSRSGNLVSHQIKVRNQVKPNLDVLDILQNSILNGTLTLCIPWLCKYLSMLDPITLRTTYYTSVINILITLYRNFGNSESSIPEHNIYLVKYTLGWFFELNNFPHSVFFERLHSNGSFKMMDCHKPLGIDRLNIADQNVLYIFCPYLEEIRKLLTSKIVAKDRITIRHITPLSAAESPKEVARKKIENQLEEAFFNGHPASLRKTVDFVAERIASTCVKWLCYNVVPDFKRNLTKELHAQLRDWIKHKRNSEDILRKKSENFALDNLKRLEVFCEAEVDKIVEKKLKSAIVALLPLDCLPQMEAICIVAAKRMCLDKVKQWTSTHIILSVLTKDISTEIAKFTSEDQSKIKPKPTFSLPPGGSDVTHNEKARSGAQILDDFRDLSVAILSTSNRLEERLLANILDDTYKTLTERNDVNEVVNFMIHMQLVDFSLLLVTFQPSLIEKYQNRFFDIWKLQGDKSEELFGNLLCQRNIMLLAQSGPKVRESWTAKAKLCAGLLRENLISCECFESQCAGFFKSNLDEETLKNVTSFLKNFVDNYKKNCTSSKFTYLLEFLSDYCNDL